MGMVILYHVDFVPSFRRHCWDPSVHSVDRNLPEADSAQRSSIQFIPKSATSICPTLFSCWSLWDEKTCLGQTFYGERSGYDDFWLTVCSCQYMWDSVKDACPKGSEDSCQILGRLGPISLEYIRSMRSPFESGSGAHATFSFRDIFYQLILHYPLRCLPPVNGRFTLKVEPQMVHTITCRRVDHAYPFHSSSAINYRRMVSLPMILVANLPFSSLLTAGFQARLARLWNNGQRSLHG
ncbi:hypothetical protein EDD85DRAFT_179400 [Armillaria nabsnona]|nr:hypothetical protein EDD85DRAFT_179400 [Armillaria nabsnona]